jgi:hypothetical protein
LPFAFSLLPFPFALFLSSPGCTCYPAWHTGEQPHA